MATETFIVDRDREVLDLLIWREYRAPTPGLIERALDLNPGLSDLGFYLPLATLVIVPTDQPVAPPRPLVKLFD